MRIINRYLFKEVLYTLLAVTPIVLVIFISNRFLAYLSQAASGKLPVEYILQLLSLKSISVLALILPLVLFLSIVIALGRLYKDSEMIVFAACGVSQAQVLRIVVFPTAVVIAIIVAVLTMYVNPWATTQSEQVEQHIKANADIRTVVPGRFKESERGNAIFYAEKLSRDYAHMHNVFIQNWHGKVLNILSAEDGDVQIEDSGDQFITLKNGNRYEWSPDRAEYKIINYEKYSLRITEKNPAPATTTQQVKSTVDLLSSDIPKDIAELQWRISLPLSTLLLAMLAVLLARTTPRQGRYAKLFVAILIYVVYNNMLGIARSWVAYGIIPPLIGMWWVHIMLLLIIGVLLVQQIGVKGFIPARREVEAGGQHL